MRRALSLGGAAVVAAVVGAACSFAFSGAIALRDAAGVQVSESAVIVPAANLVDTVFRAPRSPDAAGPETVPAPEPHDLAPTTRRGPSAGSGSAPRDIGLPSPGRDGAGAAGGDRHVGARGENSSDRGTTKAPVLTDGAPGGGEQSPAHSSRESVHEHASGLSKAPGRNDARGQAEKRPGSTEERDHERRDHARGAADRSSGPDGSCTGGGYEQSRKPRPRD